MKNKTYQAILIAAFTLLAIPLLARTSGEIIGGLQNRLHHELEKPGGTVGLLIIENTRRKFIITLKK